MSLSTKFQLKLTILTFWIKFAYKGYFRSRTGKVNITIELCIIRISLGTKFQLKLIILIFWIKFAEKRYFWSKMEKVNTIIEFCIFRLV